MKSLLTCSWDSAVQISKFYNANRAKILDISINFAVHLKISLFGTDILQHLLPTQAILSGYVFKPYLSYLKTTEKDTSSNQ